jgi:hypothetical protein
MLRFMRLVCLSYGSRLAFALFVIAVVGVSAPRTASADACTCAAERIADDAHDGRPLVAHVFVALADNDAQGIVPIPKMLGNGQDARNNLYWGARYGVKTYFTRDAGWTRLKHTSKPPSGVLERLILTKRVRRGPARMDAFVVADAWRGDKIRDTIRVFLESTAGKGQPPVNITLNDDAPLSLPAGGAAHVIAFVGHNGLMDFDAPALSEASAGAPTVSAASVQAAPRAAIVLACASRPYFESLLRSAGACPLLLTTGLMAPEAYALEAALHAWFSSGQAAEVRKRTARAYDRYQKCGLASARRLFWTPE